MKTKINIGHILKINLGILALAVLLIIPNLSQAQDQHEDHEHTAQADIDEHEGHEHDAATEESHDDYDDHADHEDESVVEVTDEAIRMAGIELARVSYGQIGRTITLPGEVGFNEDRVVHIAPRFAGIAREARYRIGDQVKAGDIVVVIESNESMSPYSITAPISGTIIDRHVTPGEFVSEENTMYIIADLSEVWVNLAVYPRDADYISRGQKTKIRAIGTDLYIEGIIEYVTPVIDVNTRSITARVILPNPDNQWRPGTFVQAEVVVDPKDGRSAGR